MDQDTVVGVENTLRLQSNDPRSSSDHIADNLSELKQSTSPG